MKRIVLAFLLTLTCVAASAAPICINSNTTLAQFGTSMANGHVRSLDVRITAGTFTAPEVTNSGTFSLTAMLPIRIYASGNSVRISGRWNADCSQQLSPALADTTIDGLGTRRFVAIGPSGIDPELSSADIEIDNLHLYRLAGTGMRAELADNSKFDLHHLRLSGGIGRQISGLLNGVNLLRNSVIESNATDRDLVYFKSDQQAVFQNNTVRNNVKLTGSNQYLMSMIKVGEAHESGIGMSYVESNIFYDNTLCSGCFELEADGLTRVSDNILGTPVRGTPLIEVSNHAVNPQFANSFGATLMTTSPARDLGSVSFEPPQATDYYGAPRLVSSVIDIGARELSMISIPGPDMLFANQFG